MGSRFIIKFKEDSEDGTWNLYQTESLVKVVIKFICLQFNYDVVELSYRYF